MEKTIEDFKNEVAISNNYSNWSYIESLDVKLLLIDKAIQLYANYVFSQGYNEGWNEAMIENVNNFDYPENK